MIDQVFFYLLLPLPLILGLMACIYGFRAWHTQTPHLKRSRYGVALWLLAAAGMLLFCRERIRGWYGFDNNLAILMLISTAGVLLALALLLGLVAAWGRSTRGVPLCPRCWYDMAGAESEADGTSTCPECGFVVGARADLVRRKRWPLLLAIAVVFQLAGQLSYQVIRADHSGFQDFIPTTALVAGMFSLPSEAILGPPSPFDRTTLAGRLANNRTAEWQKAWAMQKSLAAIAESSSVESVRRSGVLLNRMQYEGEIPLADWQRALLVLCRGKREAGEAYNYLVECYVRSRSHPDATIRISAPTDAAKSDEELKSVAPELLASLKRMDTRGQEWWSTLRLIALSDKSLPPLISYLGSRIREDDFDSSRAYSAAVLAMLSSRAPQAGVEACESAWLLPPNEKPRVFNAIARYLTPSHELTPAFQALLNCGEPALEMMAALALTGSPDSRCEGVESLIDVFQRQAVFGIPDFSMAYWAISRAPDDAASARLVGFLLEWTMVGPAQVRADAMANLIPLARDFDTHAPTILHHLDLLSEAEEGDVADRARQFAIEIRTSRSAQPAPRKTGVIR